MATIEFVSGKYRVRIRRFGVSKCKTFRSKIEAETWALRTESEIINRENGIITKRLMSDGIERYKSDVSPTHRGYKKEDLRLDKLARMLPNIPIDEVSKTDISALRDARLKSVSGSSVVREIHVLSSFFEAAIEWGWCRINPVRGVKMPKSSPHRDRVITQGEVAIMLEALGYKETEPINTFKRQVAIMFLLALETGMRAGEIENLSWDRVFPEQKRIRLETTKTGVPRDVPLTKKALNLISRLKGIDDKRLFLVLGQTRDTIFRKARTHAGLSGFTFHDSRHTAATRLAKRVDVLTLCKIFGWKNPKMAMVYYNPSAADIAEMIDSY